jgi:Tc5 transposase DNA-binding domain
MSKIKENYKSYSKEQLEAAVLAINTKEKSVRSAALFYKVPKSTLNRIVFGKNSGKKPGPVSALTIDEENSLKQYIFRCAKVGVACNGKTIIDSALYIILSRKDPAQRSTEVLTTGWLQRYLNRHDDISKRAPEMLSKASAPVTTENLKQFYENVKEDLENDQHFHIFEDPQRIFAGDETGIALNPVEKNCYAEKGSNVYQIANNKEKVQQTVMYNFQAAGAMAPPFILFKNSNQVEEIIEKMPSKNKNIVTNSKLKCFLFAEDYLFRFNESGWINRELRI